MQHSFTISAMVLFLLLILDLTPVTKSSSSDDNRSAVQKSVAASTPLKAVFYSAEKGLSGERREVSEAENVTPRNGSDHSLTKRDLNERIRQHMNEQPHRMLNYTGCDNCRKMHLDMKQASLDHIKKYVLSFLGFNVSGPPKKPGNWPEIPSYIWEQYYASHTHTGYSGPGDDWEEERVNHQTQQKYLDMSPGGTGGGGGSGATTDYMADDPNWNLRMASQQQQDEESVGPLVKTHRIYLFPNGE